jgi:outer membrane protein OmpA-like peptidoglycan-associated protein
MPPTTAALGGVLVAALAAAPGPAAAPFNISGTWEAQNEGYYALLKQSGDLVTGRNPEGKGTPHFTRGGWNEGTLVLVVLWNREPGKCDRSTFALASKGSIGAGLQGSWYNTDGLRPDSLSRTSADPGAEVAYPYSRELKSCGDLLAYELAFDSGAAVLKGTEWPILGAVAGLLKEDPKLKIRVLGHTDSTGDATKNKALSLARADAVKRALLSLSGVDAARVASDGMGPDQPLQDNGTPLGRAVNRRVEILVAH